MERINSNAYREKAGNGGNEAKGKIGVAKSGKQTNLIEGQLANVIEDQDYDAVPIFAVILILDLVVVLQRL